jgi:predicted anti-sigma-YlaC factor YlaD
MNCREFVDFLMSYLDGELESEPSRVFEEHMQLCPPCLTYLDTYRDTIRLGRFACEDAEGPPPEDAPEQLIQAILAARQKSP